MSYKKGVQNWPFTVFDCVSKFVAATPNTFFRLASRVCPTSLSISYHSMRTKTSWFSWALTMCVSLFLNFWYCANAPEFRPPFSDPPRVKVDLTLWGPRNAFSPSKHYRHLEILLAIFPQTMIWDNVPDPLFRQTPRWPDQPHGKKQTSAKRGWGGGAPIMQTRGVCVKRAGRHNGRTRSVFAWILQCPGPAGRPAKWTVDLRGDVHQRSDPF